jgi:hypothetical protein
MTVRVDVATKSISLLDPVRPISAERLPFTVRVVANEDQLHKAVVVRHAAYARHVPEFAVQLKEPEASDFDPGAFVLLAESKLDGTALGTMRIQTNTYEPLRMEASIDLPDWLQGLNLAEATRLGVSEGREGRMVKTILFKTYFLYCQRAMIDWMVITARKPLDRQYDALLFKDVFASGQLMPMRHVGNMLHRVMAFDVATAEERWIAARHPLHTFIFRTTHPDIELPPSLFATARSPVLHDRTYSRTTMTLQL